MHVVGTRGLISTLMRAGAASSRRAVGLFDHFVPVVPVVCEANRPTTRRRLRDLEQALADERQVSAGLGAELHRARERHARTVDAHLQNMNQAVRQATINGAVFAQIAKGPQSWAELDAAFDGALLHLGLVRALTSEIDTAFRVMNVIRVGDVFERRVLVPVLTGEEVIRKAVMDAVAQTPQTWGVLEQKVSKVLRAHDLPDDSASFDAVLATLTRQKVIGGCTWGYGLPVVERKV